MYWLLWYDVVDDYVERRAPLRAAHLLLAGALDDAADGAVLVFKADDAAVVEAFVQADPYVREGLVTAWRVRRWNVVIGG
jgi:uncharacterized protein YciI